MEPGFDSLVRERTSSKGVWYRPAGNINTTPQASGNIERSESPGPANRGGGPRYVPLRLGEFEDYFNGDFGRETLSGGVGALIHGEGA